MKKNVDNFPVLDTLMDYQGINAAVERVCEQISQEFTWDDRLLVIGLATGGVPLAQKVAQRLGEIWGNPVELGNLDPTFYRDDFYYRTHIKKPNIIVDTPKDLENRPVILVDDVLFTGRSVRAAMNALMDLGRPAKIRLMVLVDRGGHELPISADYIGQSVQVESGKGVRAKFEKEDSQSAVYLVEVKSV